MLAQNESLYIHIYVYICIHIYIHIYTYLAHTWTTNNTKLEVEKMTAHALTIEKDG
jgi:hypothetical protein